MFCAPQEAAPVRSYQCASPKCAADAAIGADIGADSAGCAPLNLAARADGDGVIERVRTLLRAAPDAAPMTDARGSSRPPAFRRLPVLRGGRAEGDPTHPSRARVDPGRERGSGRGDGRAAGSGSGPPRSCLARFAAADTSTTYGRCLR